MTDKELKKLKRVELIEILYYLKKENEELKAENDLLKDKLFSLADEAIELKKKQAAVSETETPEPAESASEDKKSND